MNYSARSGTGSVSKREEMRPTRQIVGSRHVPAKAECLSHNRINWLILWRCHVQTLGHSLTQEALVTKRLPEEEPCVKTSTRCVGEEPKKTLTVRKHVKNELLRMLPQGTSCSPRTQSPCPCPASGVKSVAFATAMSNPF